jgi:hypothetical protein
MWTLKVFLQSYEGDFRNEFYNQHSQSENWAMYQLLNEWIIIWFIYFSYNVSWMALMTYDGDTMVLWSAMILHPRAQIHILHVEISSFSTCFPVNWS